MNKNIDMQKLLDGILLLDNEELRTLLVFIVGFPGENVDTLRETADMINLLGSNNGFLQYHIYGLYMSPLSTLSEKSVRQRWGINGIGFIWSHNTMKSSSLTKCIRELFMNIDTMTYAYETESYYYLKQFSSQERLQLIRTRNDLAKEIMRKASYKERLTKLQKIISLLKVTNLTIGKDLVEKLTI